MTLLDPLVHFHEPLRFNPCFAVGGLKRLNQEGLPRRESSLSAQTGARPTDSLAIQECSHEGGIGIEESLPALLACRLRFEGHAYQVKQKTARRQESTDSGNGETDEVVATARRCD